MARIKKPKIKDVAKFGGVDALGTVSMNRVGTVEPIKDKYEASSVEVKSHTKLEDDRGEGDATIIRRFTFGMNPETFIKQKPTKQDLFNSHLRGIEIALWSDGLKVFDVVPPRLAFDVEKKQYSIFIAARPRNGYLLRERPRTLTEITNG